MLFREPFEQIFIYETRADEYERLGNHTEAKWQREQAEDIRRSMTGWTSHWSFFRGWHMRRKGPQGWEHRPMTSGEESDLVSAEAW